MLTALLSRSDVAVSNQSHCLMDTDELARSAVRGGDLLLRNEDRDGHLDHSPRNSVWPRAVSVAAERLHDHCNQLQTTVSTSF